MKTKANPNARKINLHILRNLYLTAALFSAFDDDEEVFDENGCRREVGYKTPGDPDIFLEYSEDWYDHTRNLYGMIAALARAVALLQPPSPDALTVNEFIAYFEQEREEIWDEGYHNHKAGNNRSRLHVVDNKPMEE